MQHVIGMKSPTIIVLNPSRSNIMFVVKFKDTITQAFSSMMGQIAKDRHLFPRTVIYCRRFSDCGDLYMMFRKFLGKDFTEPKDAPDLPQFRLVDMYHSSTDPVVKDMILSRFSTQSSLRIVISTVAFGMGIDCTNIRQIVHLGPPDDVEAYIQETGRAGRDGQRSLAALLLLKGARHQMDKTLRGYCQNASVCRRNMLFNQFKPVVNPVCSCCDICKSRCMLVSCPVCTESLSF